MINVNSAASRRNSAISKNQHVSYTAERGELGSPRAHVGAAARTWGVLMLGLGSMLAVHGVLAAAEADSPAQSATRSSAAPDGLEEIVVRAQKRTEELIKSPLAISALTQGQLQDSGVESLKDLTSTVPNVQLRTQSIFQSVGITIRGISNFIANEYGDPAVATYIDGIYVGRTQGLSGDLYDLARVEVLRGPQGTLNGRNATGGNINVITADPKDSFGAAADISIRRVRLPATTAQPTTMAGDSRFCGLPATPSNGDCRSMTSFPTALRDLTLTPRRMGSPRMAGLSSSDR